METDYRRPLYGVVLRRCQEPRRFIQVLAGPRQTGKSMLALQVCDGAGLPVHYASADDPGGAAREWIQIQWDTGRSLSVDSAPGALLMLDEVQKVPGWSEVVKRLWDEDTRRRMRLRVLILGSAPLLMQRGLTESLAGRFELVRVPHWSFQEMRDAFGFTLDQYVFHGGYPGAAALIDDHTRWRRYVLDAIVETTIARDVLLMTRIDKPALLRRTFHLACEYSGRILSYQKMLGQLQEAGNATTVAGYLDLLQAAGLVGGLQKFAGQQARRRASSPKLQVFNTALLSTTTEQSLQDARRDPEWWGHLVESAVGAHLVNMTDVEVDYWRERDREVDFVVRRGRRVLAIEVKTSRRRDARPGLDAFRSSFGAVRTVVVGAHGIALESFLQTTADDLFRL